MDTQSKIDLWVGQREEELQRTCKIFNGYGQLDPNSEEQFSWRELKAFKWAVERNNDGNPERLMSLENSVFCRPPWNIKMWAEDQDRDVKFRYYSMGNLSDARRFLVGWFSTRLDELETKKNYISMIIERWSALNGRNWRLAHLLRGNDLQQTMLNFEENYIATSPFPLPEYQWMLRNFVADESYPQQAHIVEPSERISQENREGKEAEVLADYSVGTMIGESASQMANVDNQSEGSSRMDREGKDAKILAVKSEDMSICVESGEESVENTAANFKVVDVESGVAEMETAFAEIQISQLHTEHLKVESNHSELETVANKPDARSKTEKNRRKREAQKLKKQALKEAKVQEFNLMDESLKVETPPQIQVQDKILLNELVAKFMKQNEGVKLDEIHKKAKQFVQGRIRKLALKEKKSPAYELFSSLSNAKLEKEDMFQLAAVANELGLPNYPELQNQLVAELQEKRANQKKAAATEQSMPRKDAKSELLNMLKAQLVVVDEEFNMAKETLKKEMLCDYAKFMEAADTPSDAHFLVESVKFCNSRYSFFKDVLSKSKSEIDEIDSEHAANLLNMYQKILASEMSIEQAKLMVFLSSKVIDDSFSVEAMFTEHIMGLPETDH